MNIEELFQYDQWATEKLLAAVETLTPVQFTHEFAGSLTSVRQQFVHLLTVADRYRARLAGEAVPELQPEDIATPQDLIAYETEMRLRLNDFIQRLKEEDLEQIQEHATRRGPFRATTEQTLRHMANHATYHRGQVACLLKLHGIDFADTDIIIWLNR